MQTIKKIPHIKLLIAFLLVCVGGYVVWSVLTFRITGTTPNSNNISFLVPYVDVEFSEELTKNDTLTVSSDENIVKSFEVSGSKIRVFLDNDVMFPEDRYTIDLFSVTSKDGSVIEKGTVAFTAKDGTFNELTAEQQEYILDQQQSKKQVVFSDPVLEYLPHSTLDYELSALVAPAEETGEDIVYIQAKLLLTEADYRINEEVAVQQYTQEVLDYFVSVGIDPNTYEIEYSY